MYHDAGNALRVVDSSSWLLDAAPQPKSRCILSVLKQVHLDMNELTLSLGSVKTCGSRFHLALSLIFLIDLCLLPGEGGMQPESGAGHGAADLARIYNSHTTDLQMWCSGIFHRTQKRYARVGLRPQNHNTTVLRRIQRLVSIEDDITS